MTGIVVQGKALQANLDGPLGPFVTSLTDIQALMSHSPECCHVVGLPIGGSDVRGGLLLGFGAPHRLSQRRMAGLIVLCNILSDALVRGATEITCVVEQMIGQHPGCTYCLGTDDSTSDEEISDSLEEDGCHEESSDGSGDDDGQQQGVALSPISESSEDDVSDMEFDAWYRDETMKDMLEPSKKSKHIKSSFDEGNISSTRKVHKRRMQGKAGIEEDSIMPVPELADWKKATAPVKETSPRKSIRAFEFSKTSLIEGSDLQRLENSMHPLWMSFSSVAIERDFRSWYRIYMASADHLFAIILFISVAALWTKGLLPFNGRMLQRGWSPVWFSAPFVLFANACHDRDLSGNYHTTMLASLRSIITSTIYLHICRSLIAPIAPGSSILSLGSHLVGLCLIGMLLGPLIGLQMRQKTYLAFSFLSAIPMLVFSSFSWHDFLLMLFMLIISGLCLRVIEMRARRAFAEQLNLCASY